ncbi:hypothetical protein FGB62_112g222 [Gracilaria domingensis]|nr:hypothetical protein FGB62_112g222 [Gracilaria domingensis]
MRPPIRPRRVRVAKKHTSSSNNWQWSGARSSWRTIFTMDNRAFLNALETFAASCVESSLLARVTKLGARVLRGITDAFERTWYPDVEKELVVDYGLAEPSPTDKTYVHPLTEWEISHENYYRDSFGRKVYLQLDGASAVLSAMDYRDVYDATALDDQDEHDAHETSRTTECDDEPQNLHSSEYELDLDRTLHIPPAFYQVRVQPPPPPSQCDQHTT